MNVPNHPYSVLLETNLEGGGQPRGMLIPLPTHQKIAFLKPKKSIFVRFPLCCANSGVLAPAALQLKSRAPVGSHV